MESPVYRDESAPFIPRPRPDDWQLWLLAVLCFGIGDVATTAVGLHVTGVVEVHPLAADGFERAVIASAIGLKAVAFGGCYLLWRLTPRPHCVGVPLGLTVLGTAVTLWNARVLVVVV